jgi:chromosome segregation ATPase
MGATASALQGSPRGNAGESERVTSERNEVQELKDEHESLKIMMENLEKENKELKNDLQALQISYRKLKRDNEIRTVIEEKIQNKLQECKATFKKLEEEYAAEIEAMHLSHVSDIKILQESNRELEDENRALKSANNKLKKGHEIRRNVQEELRKEFQAVEASNKKLKEEHDAEMKSMLLSHVSELKVLSVKLAT